MIRLSVRGAVVLAGVAIGTAVAGSQGSTAAAADKPATPASRASATRPAADVAVDLRVAAKSAADQALANAMPAARATLESAIAKAVGSLDPESDAVEGLSRATAEARKLTADPPAAVDRLQGGVSEALLALSFTPKLEAPLPDGFPAPAAVGKVTVKAYPAYRLARTPMTGGDKGQDGSFWVLFNHIKANDIAMTAPVEMSYARPADAGAKPVAKSMAFLYRTPSLGKVGEQGKVDVVDVPATTVVSVGVRGSYDDDRMATALAKIDRWLDGHKEYRKAGEPRYLGYNSPMVLPWQRYGEVQVPVELASEKPTPPK